MDNQPTGPEYVELRCATSFSFLRGASHPEELVDRAHALGYRALAITDRSYIIAGGRILRAGRPAELVEDEVVRRTYLGENFYMQLDA